uniref:Uncharacterized protein n=1 Tax=Siphoviridae sp. ctD6g5 TaxID=2826196 RepID=A0A8S5MRR4_9CAUD|nr:MAG TPA: hypothetical protein [Siphoviridae sp. ctD6g5]
MSITGFSFGCSGSRSLTGIHLCSMFYLKIFKILMLLSIFIYAFPLFIYI